MRARTGRTATGSNIMLCRDLMPPRLLQRWVLPPLLLLQARALARYVFDDPPGGFSGFFCIFHCRCLGRALGYTHSLLETRGLKSPLSSLPKGSSKTALVIFFPWVKPGSWLVFVSCGIDIADASLGLTGVLLCPDSRCSAAQAPPPPVRGN